MSRKEKVLGRIDQDGLGLEIGPSYDPIAPKREGFKVQTVDVAHREELVAKYEAWHVAPESLANIEEVDFVWHGEPYAELTGKRKYYDWVIASHLIEHVPDLIGFLNDCNSILKDDGVLALVVPDKRYCFDHYRPHTGIAKIIDSHLTHDKMPTPGTVAEALIHRVTKAGDIAWDAGTSGEYALLHPLEETVREMNAAMAEKKYVDVHAWCFVPHSFRLLIRDLFSMGLIPFQEVNFLPTEGCEFYVTLGRSGREPHLSRLEMLEIMERELKEELHGQPTPRPDRVISLQEQNDELAEIKRSKSWRLVLKLRRLQLALAPPNSRRARVLRPVSSFVSRLLG